MVADQPSSRHSISFSLRSSAAGNKVVATSTSVSNGASLLAARSDDDTIRTRGAYTR